jgi:uncharacterized protein (DUF1330 family)
MTVTLCVLLWAKDGREDALVDYEDRVLALLPDHGARVIHRMRSEGRDRAPLEVHVIEIPDDDAFEAFMADSRRTALADLRERAIERTEVVRVAIV